MPTLDKGEGHFMNRLQNILLLAIGLLVIFAFKSYGVPIQIDTGKYTGDYKIDNGIYQTGDAVFEIDPLPANSLHSFNVGDSGFQFAVNVIAGKAFIDANSIVPKVSASVDPRNPSKLLIRTVRIKINPGREYGGPVGPNFIKGVYYLSAYSLVNYPGIRFQGEQDFNLIPGITYFVDDGCFAPTNPASDFVFRVDSGGCEGHIPQSSILPPKAASADEDELRFNTAPVKIIPGKYDHNYYLSTIGALATTNSSTFNVIRGLTVSIDTDAKVGGSNFYFHVEADGKTVVSENPIAAQGSNNGKLTFQPVPVTITPGIDPSTGSPYTGNYLLSLNSTTYVQGVTQTYLLPSLVYWVEVGGNIQDFTISNGVANPNPVVTNAIPINITVP
jgi:hypothetical protein